VEKADLRPIRRDFEENRLITQNCQEHY